MVAYTITILLCCLQIIMRCFENILLAIRPQSKDKLLLDHEEEVLFSQLELLNSVYKESIFKNFSLIFINVQGKTSLKTCTDNSGSNSWSWILGMWTNHLNCHGFESCLSQISLLFNWLYFNKLNALVESDNGQTG